MSPYRNPVTKITDVSKYFVKNESDFSMTFVGESLEVRIPARFKTYGGLQISDVVETIGSCDLIFDDKYQTGLNILAKFVIEPSDIGSMTYKKIEYVTLKLKHGDKFMRSYRVVQNPNVVYAMWTEFVTYGKPGYWLSYTDMLALFENARALTGEGIGVSRSVFEGIIAHLARDKNDPFKQYRLTDMKKPMQFIALNSISTATTSTTARLNGSYFKDTGITSALLTDVDQIQPFEQILRGISSSTYEDPNVAGL